MVEMAGMTPISPEFQTKIAKLDADARAERKRAMKAAIQHNKLIRQAAIEEAEDEARQRRKPRSINQDTATASRRMVDVMLDWARGVSGWLTNHLW